MLQLTDEEMVELHSIYLDSDADTGACGWFPSDAARRLVELEIIERWSEERPLGGGGAIGSVIATWEFCRLTDYGHRIHEDLGLPLSKRDWSFLSRRSGACAPDRPALVSCLARGLVTITPGPPGTSVSWKRVAGKAERWRTADADI